MPPRKSSKLIWILVGIGIAIATMALLAFYYFNIGGGRSAEQKFWDDAEHYGVPNSKTMVTLGTHETVADVICRYARDGKDPPDLTELFNGFKPQRSESHCVLGDYECVPRSIKQSRRLLARGGQTIRRMIPRVNLRQPSSLKSLSVVSFNT
jgi:hypothetical protein